MRDWRTRFVELDAASSKHTPRTKWTGGTHRWPKVLQLLLRLWPIRSASFTSWSLVTMRRTCSRSRGSWARGLIVERGLADRCEARAQSVDQLREDGAYDVVTSFLVVHEIDPALKAAAFAAVARALKPGGRFLIFDEAYPEADEALRTMPTRFAALAQWYEITWGNVVNTRSELHALCREAGLQVAEETGFSRFHIMVAAKE